MNYLELPSIQPVKMMQTGVALSGIVSVHSIRKRWEDVEWIPAAGERQT